MSDKIIEITEDNLRKAIEANDLKLLAPELFGKKKKNVKRVISNVRWERNNGIIYPWGDAFDGCLDFWDDLLGKPPMLMTLEWEE